MSSSIVISPSCDGPISQGLRPIHSTPWGYSMSNIGAINHAAGDINRAPTTTTLIGQKPNPWFNVLAAVVIVAGIIYTGIHLADDLSVVRDTRAYPYILLGIALLISLGFEFVNGFHDTATGVAPAFLGQIQILESL